MAFLSKLAVGFGSVILLSSCTAMPTANPRPAGSSGGDALQVVTTFVPMTNFTKAVAGDRAPVTQLIPANIGPHDYQAKPQDAQRLATADVLLENGLSLESFLADLIANAGNKALVVVDTSEGIQPMSMADKHESEPEPEPEHGSGDPHIWLDPKKLFGR